MGECPMCQTTVAAEAMNEHVNRHLDGDNDSNSAQEQEGKNSHLPAIANGVVADRSLALALMLQQQEEDEERNKKKELEAQHLQLAERLQREEFKACVDGGVVGGVSAVAGISSSSPVGPSSVHNVNGRATHDSRGLHGGESRQVTLVDWMKSQSAPTRVQRASTAIIFATIQELGRTTPGNRVVSNVESIEFYPVTRADRGWGCGYRNIQLLLEVAGQISPVEGVNLKNLSICNIQQLIEKSWAKGFDATGAAAFQAKLVGSTSWIGTTECAALLRYLGYRSQIVNFKGVVIAAEKAVKWIWDYFGGGNKSKGSMGNLMLPLYLQWSGHSISVVGIEKKGDSFTLLVLDPSRTADSLREGLKKRGLATCRRTTKQLHRRAALQIVSLQFPWRLSPSETEQAKAITWNNITP